MRICEVKNCNNKHCAKGYCYKHYKLLKKYGKIPERTRLTPNEIIDKGDHCEMILYDKNCDEKARTLFSKNHLKKIKQYKWGLYGYYCTGKINNKLQRLHQFILDKPPKGLVTDHINRNKLDNRDENLRFVTEKQNRLNTGLSIHNKSGYKGVYWDKKSKKWIAQVKVNSKIKYLGCFINKEQAIKTRQNAEKNYYIF